MVREDVDMVREVSVMRGEVDVVWGRLIYEEKGCCDER